MSDAARHNIGDAPPATDRRAVRVVLPAPLCALANVPREVGVDVVGAVTTRAVLDALDERHPTLRGTLRHDGKRRPLVRFFACGEDVSHADADVELPAMIADGREPFIIVGAIAGG